MNYDSPQILYLSHWGAINAKILRLYDIALRTGVQQLTMITRALSNKYCNHKRAKRGVGKVV